MPPQIDIKRTIRSSAPRLPYSEMKNNVLGQGYELSLVMCGDDLARKMNKQYRRKAYAANVLSFPLSKTEGEIFLNIRAAQREAKKYGVSLSRRLALLFVHGLYHLKGFEHSDRTEALETKTLKKFGL